MVALSSVAVSLRSPFTDTVLTTPSLVACPPNIPIIRPSIPSNWTCDFSVVFTSAPAAAAVTSSPVNASATPNRRRIISVPFPSTNVRPLPPAAPCLGGRRSIGILPKSRARCRPQAVRRRTRPGPRPLSRLAGGCPLSATGAALGCEDRLQRGIGDLEDLESLVAPRGSLHGPE